MNLKKKLFCFDLDGVICKNTKYKSSNLINYKKSKLSKLTVNSLKSWKLKYHKLVFGKIYYDLIIDDKSINYKSDWTKNIFKKN
jgi:hypothetical protein